MGGGGEGKSTRYLILVFLAAVEKSHKTVETRTGAS
jgi:hypothetical protein